MESRQDPPTDAAHGAANDKVAASCAAGDGGADSLGADAPPPDALHWTRNDPPAASMRRILVIAGVLITAGMVSVVMAYFGPNHSPIWTLRFDRLEGRAVPPGTGFLIEAFRLVFFVWMTTYILGTRFTTIVRKLFSFWVWSRKLAIVRVVICVLVLFFVISESRRHLSLSEAPSSMVAWAASRGLETTAESERISYAWYLPYSLISYIVVFGGLFAFPFMRFWMSDFSYMQRQTARFVEVQATICDANQLLDNQRRFAHEFMFLSRRYVDLLGTLCVGVQYEYWIGQLTLSDAGLQTAAMGWFVVGFAAVFVVAIGATYARGLSATEDAAVEIAGADFDNARGNINVTEFLKRIFLSNVGGLAVFSMVILGVHAASTLHSSGGEIARANHPASVFSPTGARGSARRHDADAMASPRGDRRIVPAQMARPRRLIDLHLLSIGVSRYKDEVFNLEYAEVDATKLAQAFSATDGQLFSSVTSTVLVNEEANHNAILLQLRELQSAVTQDDLAIISVAGHGITDDFDDFFFLPHDYDTKAAVGSSAIAWDSFKRWISRMPCTVWVILDTCHSGRVTIDGSRGVGESEVQRATQKAVNNFSSSQTGVVIMAGSLSGQSALEKSDWGHGALTLSLLEGISGQYLFAPDRSNVALPVHHDDDNVLSLEELRFFVTKRVKELTDGRQSVVTNHTGNIDLDHVPLRRISQSSETPDGTGASPQ